MLALDGAQRRALGEALLALCAARVIVLAMPFPRARVWAANGRIDTSRGDDSAAVVRWAVLNASRIVPGGRNCLVRALAAQRMLSRRGVESELKIGACNDAERGFEAHAWLESSGVIVVGDAEPGRYQTLSREARNAP